MEISGVCVVTDPGISFFPEEISGFLEEYLGKINGKKIFLISHGHPDHFDPALTRIFPDAVFII